MANGAASARSSPKPPEAPAMPALHVVLVDDDDLFRESLWLNLRDEGCRVTDFPDGPQALAYFSEDGQADVILLDWKMPGIDGLEVLRRLRLMAISVPVIFLTALTDQVYEDAALDGGAVDFIEKSRSFSILRKRMRLITDGVKPVAVDSAQPDAVRIGGLELRGVSKRALWNGAPVGLTVMEFTIVKILATRAGEDITYREIFDTVHDADFVSGTGAEGYRASVRAVIKRIRQRFKDVDDSFAAIENYPGFGYRWRHDG